jgi:hypothetical protein
MKYFWLLFLIPTISFSQPGYRVFDFIDPSLKTFSIGTQIGLSNYYGDLCETNDCYVNQSFSTGITTTLRLNDYFFFNVNGLYYRIEGSDALSGDRGRLPRNLSFRADNFELSFLGNFEFMNYNSFRYITRKEFPLSLHSFMGLGLTTNNPKAYYRGQWYELRPLMTEQNKYSPVALVIPFGIGVGYRFTESINCNLNVGYRYTFTDYLDDVSTQYQDPSTFTNPIALELQYRGDEVPFGRKGSVRGNPGSKDGYLIFGLKVEFKVPNVKLDFLTNRSFGQKKSYEPTRRSARRRRN